MKIRFIGDVHGKYIPYAKLCKKAETEDAITVQIGDMGFSYGHFKHFGLDNGKHFWFGGNHDNYDIYDKADCCLGHFGEVFPESRGPFFFVRGAYSIDHAQRVEGRDWWRAEELDMAQWREVFAIYDQVRPRIMVTHDCPDIARDHMLIATKNPFHGSLRIKTRTGQMLQHLFDLHQPNLWVFGHWHKTKRFKLKNCTFQCLGELDWIDI